VYLLFISFVSKRSDLLLPYFIFTLNRFEKIPLTDIVLLSSIDRFMNETRSVTNLIEIVVAGTVISKLTRKKAFII